MRSVVPKLTARGESRAVDRIVGLLWGAGEWDALLNLQSQRAVPAEFLWSVWNAAMQIQEKFPSDPAIAAMWDVAATVRETDPDLAGRLETSIDRLAGLQVRTPGIVRSIREMALPDLLAFADYTTARLRESDVGMQFAAVCSTLCPSQTPACIAAANPVSVLGGFPVKSSLGSPVAILIPAERYAHSRRAIGEVLRRHVWFSQFAREPGRLYFEACRQEPMPGRSCAGRHGAVGRVLDTHRRPTFGGCRAPTLRGILAR